MCCHLLDLDLGLEIRVPFIKLQKIGQFSEKRRVNESLENSRTDTHSQPHVWDNPGLRPPPPPPAISPPPHPSHTGLRVILPTYEALSNIRAVGPSAASTSNALPHFLLQVVSFHPSAASSIVTSSDRPWWLSWQRIRLQCGRPGFDPWVGKIPWRRERLPTPAFWPGETHEQRSLAGYSPRGHKESDTTEET